MPGPVSVLRRSPRIAAATLLAALCAGCFRPLATQHEFFLPVGGSAGRTGAQVEHVIGHHRALRAASHACGTHSSARTPPEESGPDPAGPDPGAMTARTALADLCASRRPAAPAAYGGASNAYRRWAEDEVRELPEASETAASAAGGS